MDELCLCPTLPWNNGHHNISISENEACSLQVSFFGSKIFDKLIEQLFGLLVTL